MFSHKILLTSQILFSLSCVPDHLKKYSQQSPGLDPMVPQVDSQFVPQAPSSPPAAKKEAKVQDNYQRPRALIYPVGEKIFAFKMTKNKVWQTAIQVLIENYNITTIDKNSGVITTEWDRFLKDNVIFRNRVSVVISEVNRREVRLSIHNNYEKVLDNLPGKGHSNTWVPSTGGEEEIRRLVSNMAIALGQPLPTFFNQNQVTFEGAKSGKRKESF